MNELPNEAFKPGGCNALVSRGAQGIILGCTEIPLIVKQKDYDIPLFDTTRIHAEAAVEYAIGRQNGLGTTCNGNQES